MAPFTYRCPNTGLKVQGWIADEPTDDGAETYESVTCLVCTRLHLSIRKPERSWAKLTNSPPQFAVSFISNRECMTLPAQSVTYCDAATCRKLGEQQTFGEHAHV